MRVYVSQKFGTLMANYSQVSGLYQLLESASYRFVNDVWYKNDLRYLRCWIQYSKHVENPKAFFALLNSNEIGLDLAMFYEEYAEVLWFL